MKCLFLISFSHNKNYCHANAPLLAVPIQNNVNTDWYPNSLIQPRYIRGGQLVLKGLTWSWPLLGLRRSGVNQT